MITNAVQADTPLAAALGILRGVALHLGFPKQMQCMVDPETLSLYAIVENEA